MKFKNPFHSTHWSAKKIILLLWLIFSILYVGKGVRNYVLNGVYFAGQRAGQEGTINEIISLAQKCEPVQLYSGKDENRIVVDLMDTKCPKKK